MLFSKFHIKHDYDRIQEIWAQLYCEKQHSFFVSWGWFDVWLAQLDEHANVSLVVGFENNQPQLAFFLGEIQKRFLGLPIMKQFFINSTGVALLDDLMIEYNAIPSLQRDSLLGDNYLHSYSVLELLDSNIMSPASSITFPGFSSLPNDLKDLQANGYYFENRAADSRYVDLSQVRANENTYLGLISRNKRSQINRSNRLLQSFGELRIHKAATVAESLEMYRMMISLHQKSWQLRGQSGAFSNRFLTGFHEGLIKSNNRQVEIYSISAGEHVIGYIYGFISQDGFLYYQSGFDDFDDNKIKPGLSSHALLIDYMAQRNLNCYDFLVGDEDYKRSLATDSNRLNWFTLYRQDKPTRMMMQLRKIKRWFNRRFCR